MPWREVSCCCVIGGFGRAEGFWGWWWWLCCKRWYREVMWCWRRREMECNPIAAPCNNVCMWFVTDSDIQMRFCGDMSCLYGRCELSFMIAVYPFGFPRYPYESSCFLLHKWPDDIWCFWGAANEISLWNVVLVGPDEMSWGFLVVFHALFCPPTRFPCEMLCSFCCISLWWDFLMRLTSLCDFILLKSVKRLSYEVSCSLTTRRSFLVRFCGCLLRNSCLVRFSYEISNALCSTVFLWDAPFEITCFLWHQFSWFVAT